MAQNPLIAQGTLNRLRGSINIPGNTTLNITAPFLGKSGISLALDGESVVYLATMTGAVTSPEPYLMVTCRAALLKTQSLSGIWKAQMEDNSVIGNAIVTPDAKPLGLYNLLNCSIKNVAEMNFAGEDPQWVIEIGGYYAVNSSLFDLQ